MEDFKEKTNDIYQMLSKAGYQDESVFFQDLCKLINLRIEKKESRTKLEMWDNSSEIEEMYRYIWQNCKDHLDSDVFTFLQTP